MEEKIKEALEEIRPALQAHGGDAEFVSLDGKTVKMKLQGHCAQCAFAAMTIKNGIEATLREKVDPELTVERV
jgi:Fe-S cluster biogenesis protein NfuA